MNPDWFMRNLLNVQNKSVNFDESVIFLAIALPGNNLFDFRNVTRGDGVFHQRRRFSNCFERLFNVIISEVLQLSLKPFSVFRFPIYLPYRITNFKDIYSMLLGEETSGNHHAYRRGHLDITILNEIRAAKECGRN